MARFILDHNFPFQATNIPWPPSVQLTPLDQYDQQLIVEPNDWRILLELNRRGDVDGFITDDAAMLNLPTEMAVMRWSQLILVVTAEVGHDPLAATGLLMMHLPEIAARRQAGVRPQVYRLRARTLGHQEESIHVLLRKIADNQNAQVDQMLARERAKIRSALA